ncbi:MAG: ABC transporter ATP-binding protein [Wujia sp.]
MILELRNVYKTYNQGSLDVPVLKDINLSVEEGEYVAIMGPSGSGKSTLMNIIGCLDKATSGTYILDGEDIGNYNDRQLSYVRNKSIGFVFQTFNLLPRQTALDNVGLPLQYAGVPKKQRKEKCLKALQRVGLEDRVNFKPTQLSGGQKQRVAIARAIVNEPKILLADEPTGALDSKSGLQVMELFDQLHKEGATIIMITHSDEIAGYADRIIKIIDGELLDGRYDGRKELQELDPDSAAAAFYESGQEVEE